mmetsp:Transcript_118139/g.381310  ORF Transcript_118139/g.381310 Transcript_118139/m.381310 type:complete len:253 (-) Transcript_118139:448-1206(-)
MAAAGLHVRSKPASRPGPRAVAARGVGPFAAAAPQAVAPYVEAAPCAAVRPAMAAAAAGAASAEAPAAGCLLAGPCSAAPCAAGPCAAVPQVAGPWAAPSATGAVPKEVPRVAASALGWPPHAASTTARNPRSPGRGKTPAARQSLPSMGSGRGGTSAPSCASSGAAGPRCLRCCCCCAVAEPLLARSPGGPCVAAPHRRPGRPRARRWAAGQCVAGPLAGAACAAPTGGSHTPGPAAAVAGSSPGRLCAGR